MIPFADVRHTGSYRLEQRVFSLSVSSDDGSVKHSFVLEASSWLLVRTILDESMHKPGCSVTSWAFPFSPSPPEKAREFVGLKISHPSVTNARRQVSDGDRWKSRARAPANPGAGRKAGGLSLQVLALRRNQCGGGKE